MGDGNDRGFINFRPPQLRLAMESSNMYNSDVSCAALGTTNPSKAAFRLTSVGREANVMNVEELFQALPPRICNSEFFNDSDVDDVNDLDFTNPRSLSRNDNVQFIVGSAMSIEAATSAAEMSASAADAFLSAFGSQSSYMSIGPICRICHQGASKDQPLISPCRCDGTLKHIHNDCLNRWLKISRKKGGE